MEAVAENRLNSIQAIFKEMNPDERKHALYALSSKIGDSETILQTIDSNQLESLTQSVAKYQVMNRALEMISVETDFDKSVNNLLEMIGRELAADRCYVFHFTDDGKYCDNTHEWTVRPEIAEKATLQHIPSSACN